MTTEPTDKTGMALPRHDPHGRVPIPGDDYEALGIFEDTWTCVAIMPLRDAKEYTWALARVGVPCKAYRDPDGKRFHVAVQGGLKHNPASVFVTFGYQHVRTCTAASPMQHPTLVLPDPDR